ncbi:hypothetical protein K491DRAFT_685010 [Lophiostoma macrostomum CBS 122681]|uniref:Protein kinase domain-containing protein n=1 Tax=Lophiostoma macrostomum CBS 122681 TaxID=1314788 RepID=A0A6A6SJP8_9PLEO|nr:hypothetical protein K491DRAFT_685010 [Lophiostoma macrostomum CBS 122681]
MLELDENDKSSAAVIPKDLKILGLVFRNNHRIFVCMPRNKASAATFPAPLQAVADDLSNEGLLAVKVPRVGYGGEVKLYTEKLFWDQFKERIHNQSLSEIPAWYGQNLMPYHRAYESSEGKVDWISHPLVNRSVRWGKFREYAEDTKTPIEENLALRLVHEIGTTLNGLHTDFNHLHNDLHGGNILLSLRSSNNGSRLPRFTLIDFEEVGPESLALEHTKVGEWLDFYKIMSESFLDSSKGYSKYKGSNLPQHLRKAWEQLNQHKDSVGSDVSTLVDSVWKEVLDVVKELMDVQPKPTQTELPQSVIETIEKAIEAKGFTVTEKEKEQDLYS